MKLTLELGCFDSVLEHLHPVDKDHRDVITISVSKLAVLVDVNLHQ
jgi:hypothetical protein